MADYDLIVRNAKIVTEDRTMDGDIAVKGGVIAAVEPGIKGKGTREIDAGGKFVLPGGIDSHAHIEQKSGFGIMCADDFYSGTVSAAFGGTTTVIPFAAQHRGKSLRQVVNDYHEAATPKAVIDRLNAEVVAVMNDPDTVKRFAEQGADAETSTPEALGKYVEAEIAKWKKVITAAKITAD